jgi:hypothetical protein
MHLLGSDSPGAIPIPQLLTMHPYEPTGDEAEFDDQAHHGFRAAVNSGNGESRPP